jgi:hypothetical protein
MSTAPPECAEALIVIKAQNVFTRGLGDGGKRPVMVWYHGGAMPGHDGSCVIQHDRNPL